jgi:nucleoside-diphosphate-sugar epimerase
MTSAVGIIGCGWLGRALATDLIEDGIRVVGTTTSVGGTDLLREIGVEPVVARFGPELEGSLAVMKELDVIVVAIPPGRGSTAVTEAGAIAGIIREADPAVLVQISTSSVYPDGGGTVVEDDAIRDHRLFLVEEAYRGLDCRVAILRCTGLFGPGRLILPYVLRAGRPVDPDQRVNLVEQRDVVRAVRRVLDEPVSDTFNICADEHPTRAEFYRAIAERTGLGVPEFRPSDEGGKIVDGRKFRDRFEFRYEFPDPLKFPV